MAINFSVHQTPKPKGQKGGLSSHARAICQGTYKMEDICKLVRERSTASSADVKSVLDSLVWVVGYALGSGYHIELDDLGYFSPSLHSSDKNKEKGIVSIDGVNFRCSVKLKELLKEAGLKEIKVKMGTEDPVTRKDKMLKCMAVWGHLSPRMYAEEMECSRYRAEADLKMYVEQGVLKRVGFRNKVMYLMAETMDNVSS